MGTAQRRPGLPATVESRIHHRPQHEGDALAQHTITAELMPEVGVPNAVDGRNSQSGITKSEHLHGENLSLAQQKCLQDSRESRRPHCLLGRARNYSERVVSCSVYAKHRLHGERVKFMCGVFCCRDSHAVNPPRRPLSRQRQTQPADSRLRTGRAGTALLPYTHCLAIGGR